MTSQRDDGRCLGWWQAKNTGHFPNFILGYLPSSFSAAAELKLFSPELPLHLRNTTLTRDATRYRIQDVVDFESMSWFCLRVEFILIVLRGQPWQCWSFRDKVWAIHRQGKCLNPCDIFLFVPELFFDHGAFNLSWLANFS